MASISEATISEDEIPAADPPKREKPQKGKPSESVSDSDAPAFNANEDPTGQVNQLLGLAKFHPLFSFFIFVAKHHYSRRQSLSSKVDQMKAEHAKFYWSCIWIDFFLTLLFAVLVLGVVAVTLWKTLIGPLPFEG